MITIRAHILCSLGLLAATAVSAAAMPQPGRGDEFDLIDADIERVQAAFESGTLTAEALTRAYLARISAYDDGGPRINSLISINSTGLEQARALDAERAERGPRGPLHGIPIVVGDSFNTADLPTTGGSAALRGHEPFGDAYTVARLRDAGAIVIGKSNLSELSLCFGRPGYSSAGGQTRNPYNLRRAASGAHAGAAAAVAANLALLGLAADTAGSLRGPAAVSALVAIRPTPGLTSRAGLIPTALSLDSPGPLARSVRDAALMLGVLAAVDEADPLTLESAPHQVDDYVRTLSTDALQGAHLGVVRDFRGGNREVDAFFGRSRAKLSGLGAELVDVRLPEGFAEAPAMIRTLITTEFRDQIDAYLINTEGGMPHSLAELLRMSRSPLIAGSGTPVNPGRIDGIIAALESPGLADLAYLQLVGRRLPALRASILEIMAAQGLDALVLPTMLCPASSLLDDYDSSYDCAADDPALPAYLASLTGLPEITVPMGYSEQGLPLGLSFVGQRFGEARIIGLAYAFEQGTTVRRPPTTAPALLADAAAIPAPDQARAVPTEPEGE